MLVWSLGSLVVSRVRHPPSLSPSPSTVHFPIFASSRFAISLCYPLTTNDAPPTRALPLVTNKTAGPVPLRAY